MTERKVAGGGEKPDERLPGLPSGQQEVTAFVGGLQSGYSPETMRAVMGIARVSARKETRSVDVTSDFVPFTRAEHSTTYINEAFPGDQVLGSGDTKAALNGKEEIITSFDQKGVIWCTAGKTDEERKQKVAQLQRMYPANFFVPMCTEIERGRLMEVAGHIIRTYSGTEEAEKRAVVIATGMSTCHVKGWGDAISSGTEDLPRLSREAIDSVSSKGFLPLVVLGGSFRFAVVGGTAPPGEVKFVTELNPEAVAKNPAAMEVCEFLNPLIQKGKIEAVVGSSKHC